MDILSPHIKGRLGVGKLIPRDIYIKAQFHRLWIRVRDRDCPTIRHSAGVYPLIPYLTVSSSDIPLAPYHMEITANCHCPYLATLVEEITLGRTPKLCHLHPLYLRGRYTKDATYGRDYILMLTDNVGDDLILHNPRAYTQEEDGTVCPVQCAVGFEIL
jgi:hypothetical protein